MDPAITAADVLEACGGADNVTGNAVCMTRLRLVLKDPSRVDTDRLETLHGVLGVRRRGASGVEVVFGPAIVDAIGREFSSRTDLPLERKTAKAITQMTASGVRNVDHLHSTHRYGGADASSVPQGDDGLDKLRQLLESPGALTNDKGANRTTTTGPTALVLNGPNLNLLGVREPDIYGRETYDDLVHLVERAGRDLGFSKVACFQSNHEGVLVDRIQQALGTYDGIVFNPAAYTHTSIALLDALKAVGVPTVEVHISDVPAREAFRQVSYVRDACIDTVIGEGPEGYAHALAILKRHLDKKKGA